MRLSQRLGLLLFLYAQLALCGFAQSVDSAGNLYIATGGHLYVFNSIHNRVGQFPTEGITPSDAAIDSAGNLYIADSGKAQIFKITTTGIISAVAGKKTSRGIFAGFNGDGKAAVEAQLSIPCGVAIDSAGNLYIADTMNNRVRKVTTAGIINTIAGTGKEGYSGDGGGATEAKLKAPMDVAIDSAGNLYIADAGNRRIRKVTTAGIISTVAGKGPDGYSGDGGPATEAKISAVTCVVIDAAGNLYIADAHNNRIRKVTTAGIISTVAGKGQGYSGDGGPATEAKFYWPQHVALDSAGNLYIDDSVNHLIRKVTTAGIISTVLNYGLE
jgi:trimeric autotransporter adhesin